MKKKTAAKPKTKPAKAKKTKAVASKDPVAQSAPPRGAAPKPSQDPRFAQTVQNYESGLKLMQEHKFERAKGVLEKVVAGPIKELADRAQAHLNSCNQQL